MANKRKSKKKPNSATNLLRRNHKSVNITDADNGFVVSSFSNEGEKTMIAKTKKEAKKFAEKMLGL